mmetsp:Transcript_20206/g.65876  ORF Transcript_20206/g.65876 Transcript_20206/m.65876 type:complete len:356 (+) Transcript_20206:880-1947(+)
MDAAASPDVEVGEQRRRAGCDASGMQRRERLKRFGVVHQRAGRVACGQHERRRARAWLHRRPQRFLELIRRGRLLRSLGHGQTVRPHRLDATSLRPLARVVDASAERRPQHVAQGVYRRLFVAASRKRHPSCLERGDELPAAPAVNVDRVVDRRREGVEERGGVPERCRVGRERNSLCEWPWPAGPQHLAQAADAEVAAQRGGKVEPRAGRHTRRSGLAVLPADGEVDIDRRALQHGWQLDPPLLQRQLRLHGTAHSRRGLPLPEDNLDADGDPDLSCRPQLAQPRRVAPREPADIFRAHAAGRPSGAALAWAPPDPECVCVIGVGVLRLDLEQSARTAARRNQRIVLEPVRPHP